MPTLNSTLLTRDPMIRRRSRPQPWQLAVVGAIVATWLCAAPCEAQVQRYQPARSTVSPYVNLTRLNNFGGLPNYYSFVRPQIQQQRFNQREQSYRRQQGNELQQLQDSFDRGLSATTAPTGTGSWFLTSPTRSTYLDASPFYPPPTGRARRR